MRNTIITFLTALMLLSACKDSVRIQRQYVSDRDRCRNTAEQRYSVYTESSDKVQSEKERTAMLLTMFSECMKGVDWKVAGSKTDKDKTKDKDKEKEKEKTAEGAAPVAVPAAAAGSGYYILMPATVVPAQPVAAVPAAPASATTASAAAKDDNIGKPKKRELGDHFVESNPNAAKPKPKKDIGDKLVDTYDTPAPQSAGKAFAPAPMPPAPQPASPSLESIINRP